MMSQNPRRALAACNVFAASQCLYQTGIELPVASSMADDMLMCVFQLVLNGHQWTEVDDESSYLKHNLVAGNTLHLGG